MKEPPLFVHWYEFSNWLLDRTEKFPKKSRFSFVQRIDNLTVEHISHSNSNHLRQKFIDKFSLDI